MKKLYILLVLSLTFSFAHAQWAGFNNNGSDGFWSNDANWAFPGGTTELLPDQDIDIYVGPTAATLDEDYTAKRFRMPANKTENFTLTGDSMLTIDIASSTQGNDDASGKAIWNESTAVTTLSFDCDVTIANSVTPDQFKGVSVFSTATAGSIIEFAASRTLTIGGTATTSFWGTGEFHVNGAITGSQGILLGAAAKVFFGSSTSDVSGYTGPVTLTTNSDLTLNSNGSSSILNSKIQCNGSDGTLTLESENVITPDEIRVSKNAGQVFVLNMNINANQTFKGIKIKGDGSILNLNIDPSVTSVTFSANNANWHANAVVNIIGYQEGVVKFGTDDTALNGGAYLANFQIDGAAPSEPLALDSSGNLVYLSSLSVKDYNAFDFAVYPNPAQDRISIQTQEQIKSIQLYDMLGRLVKKEKGVSNSIDISTLNTGFYMLKLETEDGLIATRKIIKK